MNLIRVVHILNSFGTGGLEKGISTVIQGSSDVFEHIVLCLSEAGDSTRLLPSTTEVIELRKPPGNSPLHLLRIARMLKSLSPDLVHTRNWSAMDAIIAARMAGISSIVHGEHGWEIQDPNGLNPRRVRVRRVLSHCVREYTCVSKAMETWLKEVIKVKRPITQIYNGVDTELYFPAGEASRIHAELGIPSSAFLLGAVGRTDPIKDHPTLFRAFGIVRNYVSDAFLLVIGDGPERARLEAVAGEGTIFLGNRPDVPELLRSLDVFVLPSKNEGVSNTILEAMATAVPVVATKVGGTPELVEEGRTGFLIEPGDAQAMAAAILLYADKPELRSKHGQAGRKRVLERFAVQTMVQGYEDVYLRVGREAHTVV